MEKRGNMERYKVIAAWAKSVEQLQAEMESVLNEMNARGWEFVQAVMSHDTVIHLIFKRPAEEDTGQPR